MYAEGTMALVVLTIGAMLWAIVTWKHRHRRSARTRRNKPLRHLTILP